MKNIHLDFIQIQMENSYTSTSTRQSNVNEFENIISTADISYMTTLNAKYSCVIPFCRVLKFVFENGANNEN